ncbi:MAG: hypothetical protein GY856_47655 [bacterium]|nr:hypothetical protein [bacterium]
MADCRFVEHLPDLIHPQDYSSDPEGRRVRLRIRPSADGVEVLGDAMRPAVLEELLEELEPEEIEQMLCG